MDPGRATASPALPMRPGAPTWQQIWRQRRCTGDLWLYGYASLIWRPEPGVIETRAARVHGWHRALRMRSRVNRGTPEVPGLVFALLPGGACRGVVLRIPERDAAAALERLWAREMPTGVYDPRWLACRTDAGCVQALAFTLDRRSPALLAGLDDAALLATLRQARGRCGSTLDYLLRTAEALRAQGVRDRAVERMVALARRHRIADPAGVQEVSEPASCARTDARSASVSTSTSTPGSSTATGSAG